MANSFIFTKLFLSWKYFHERYNKSAIKYCLHGGGCLDTTEKKNYFSSSELTVSLIESTRKALLSKIK